MGPGRAPWVVLWASKVARAGSFSKNCVPPRQAERTMETQIFQHFSFRSAPPSRNPFISVFFALLRSWCNHTALKISIYFEATMEQQPHFKFSCGESHKRYFGVCPQTVLLRVCARVCHRRPSRLLRTTDCRNTTSRGAAQ